MKKFSCIALIFIVCLCTFCACKDGDASDENAVSIVRQPGTPAGSEKEAQEEVEEEKLFIVQELNTEEEYIVLKSTDYDKNYIYHYTLTTRFLDKYGNTTSSLNFTPGTVVTLGERKSKGVIGSVQMSDTVWRYTDVTNFSYDTEKNLFVIGGENYKLTDETVVFSGDVIAGLSDIGEDDVLNIVGKDKTIYTISVVTGHGYLLLANTEKFEGSLIYIGNTLITAVTSNMQVSVPEGTYDVTVANNGYGGTKTIEIERNNTTVLDLAELEGEGPKTCKLTISATVPNASIYIDGEQIEAGLETEVTYGRHTLSISVEGYDTWTKTLYVNSATANISIDPTEGDSGSTSASNSNSSGNSNSSSNTTNNNTTTADSNNNSNNANNSSDNNSSSDSSTNKQQTELDYLSTLSSLINQLTGTTSN